MHELNTAFLKVILDRHLTSRDQLLRVLTVSWRLEVTFTIPGICSEWRSGLLLSRGVTFSDEWIILFCCTVFLSLSLSLSESLSALRLEGTTPVSFVCHNADACLYEKWTGSADTFLGNFPLPFFRWNGLEWDTHQTVCTWQSETDELETAVLLPLSFVQTENTGGRLTYFGVCLSLCHCSAEFAFYVCLVVKSKKVTRNNQLVLWGTCVFISLFLSPKICWLKSLDQTCDNWCCIFFFPLGWVTNPGGFG